jgi:hypothetical protein
MPNFVLGDMIMRTRILLKSELIMDCVVDNLGGLGLLTVLSQIMTAPDFRLTNEAMCSNFVS